MKKTFFCIVLALTMIFPPILTGCKQFDLRTSEEIRDDLANDFMTAMNSGNEEELKKLFAAGKVSDISSFDDDIHALCEYVNGEILRFQPNGMGGTYDSDDDLECGIEDYAVKFYTADHEYRVAFYYCTDYISNGKIHNDMIGLWSLYIINIEDYVRTGEYTYWGDGKETTGINIGVNPTDPN